MDNILMASEIDFYIDTMKPTNLDEIGTKPFLDWHQRLQKINQQAVIEASSLKEEYVKEVLVSMQKVNVLVHEAVLISVWKTKILPLLLCLNPQPENTFLAYTILFHEAVSVALIELTMFHPSTPESLGDIAADLLSYAYDSVAQLLVIDHNDDLPHEKAEIELRRQQDDLAFGIGIRCLSILRYIAEHSDRLTYGIIDRLLNVHDVPVLLIEVLLHHPWHQNGLLYKNNQWIKWDGEGLPQCEAQIWLALHQVLLNPNCGPHYAITDSRKSQLMKLLPIISPVLLDQLSPLIDLKYWLCQLSVSSQPAAPPKPILLETILEIKNKILAQGERKWKKIAKQQLPIVFCTDQKTLMEIAQGLTEAYNLDLIEKLDDDKARTCEKCGNSAIQRCSKCKSVWYCGKQCQVDDWSKHKVHCIEATT
nr:zinc finger MYND domain-containing protein 10 [Onthophagus taurus]